MALENDAAIMIALGKIAIRAVAAYAATCARPALALFERSFPADGRPRAAVDVAQHFADGAERSKGMRDAAWAAMRAAHDARDAGDLTAAEAARAAMAAAGAGFLHPLAKATQVKHILGSAAHAIRAFELAAVAGGPDVADVARDLLDSLAALASPAVADVLRRYPAAPPGGGRVGELVRQLDARVRLKGER